MRLGLYFPSASRDAWVTPSPAALRSDNDRAGASPVEPARREQALPQDLHPRVRRRVASRPVRPRRGPGDLPRPALPRHRLLHHPVRPGIRGRAAVLPRGAPGPIFRRTPGRPSIECLILDEMQCSDPHPVAAAALASLPALRFLLLNGPFDDLAPPGSRPARGQAWLARTGWLLPQSGEFRWDGGDMAPGDLRGLYGEAAWDAYLEAAVYSRYEGAFRADPQTGGGYWKGRSRSPEGVCAAPYFPGRG
ncbi:hypothetical protein DFJ74DRAFT_686557 [Hyaloraphidium curvatum]|nr:hypothetical protein DFJ74DRAFT_686557 [Hyaloraphidium curvatum]